MASYPIVELVAQNIETTLIGVRINNGYQTDLTVLRPANLGAQVQDGLTEIFIDDTTPENQLTGSPGERIDWRQKFIVTVFAVVSDSSDQPIDQRLLLMRSDVEKALMADPYRGMEGKVVDTIMMGAKVHYDHSGTFKCLFIEFDVIYRVLRTNPYASN